MEHSSKQLLMKLVTEQGFIIMGHSNYSKPALMDWGKKQLPKMYNSENISELNFPETPIFIVKKEITEKRFLGIPYNVVSYIICAMFIESHRIQVYVYGEEYNKAITDITEVFSKKVEKSHSVVVETQKNPGVEYFFPKSESGKDGYIGSGYLRLYDPTELSKWMKYFFWVSFLCTIIGVFIYNPIVFRIGFISLLSSTSVFLFYGVLNSGSRIRMYLTTEDHFKSAVVRKQLIDLEPISKAIDEGKIVRFYD